MAFPARVRPDVSIGRAARGLQAQIGGKLASRPSVGGAVGLGGAGADRSRQAAAADLARFEEQLVQAHLQDFPAAQPPKAQVPDPVDVREIAGRIAEGAGLPDLRAKLAPYGTPPKAPEPEPIDKAALIRMRRKEAVRKVPLLRFGEQRHVAKESRIATEAEIVEEEKRLAAEARELQSQLDGEWEDLQRREREIQDAAEREAEAETRRRVEAHAVEQKRLDEDWTKLQRNDPVVVIRAVEQAFADNEAPAAPLDCNGATLTVAMKFGQPSLVPEKRPDVTPTGKPTLKNRTKTDRNQLYFDALASNVLATAKEAFAVAPAIEEVAVIAVREEEGRDAGHLAVVYAGRLARDDVAGWSGMTYPSDVVVAADDSLFHLKGRTEELVPLELDDEPGLRSMVEDLAEGLGLRPLL